MQVASLSLSKELYELSGWKDTDDYWVDLEQHPLVSDYEEQFIVVGAKGALTTDVPAYDLGFLIRKLPHRTKFRDFELHKVYDDVWWAGYTYQDEFVIKCEAPTPEDALVLLAIELINQKVIEV